MNEHYGLKVKAMGLAELVANAIVPRKNGGVSSASP